jgi:hypothetical protein
VNNGKVTFFAYGASGATASVPNGLTGPTFQTSQAGTPKFEFTVQNDVDDQVDLVADVLTDQMYSSNGGKVDFAFEHILSKIAFSAKTLANYSADATVKVTGFKLTIPASTIQTNGTFTFDTGSPVGTWTLATSGKTYIPNGQQDLYTGSGVTLSHVRQELRSTTPTST